jgi:hypothetical protein
MKSLKRFEAPRSYHHFVVRHLSLLCWHHSPLSRHHNTHPILLKFHAFTLPNTPPKFSPQLTLRDLDHRAVHVQTKFCAAHEAPVFNDVTGEGATRNQQSASQVDTIAPLRPTAIAPCAGNDALGAGVLADVTSASDVAANKATATKTARQVHLLS